jgi:hypothetical protein
VLASERWQRYSEYTKTPKNIKGKKEETLKSYLFANGINRLNGRIGLNRLAHLFALTFLHSVKALYNNAKT